MNVFYISFSRVGSGSLALTTLASPWFTPERFIMLQIAEQLPHTIDDDWLRTAPTTGLVSSSFVYPGTHFITTVQTTLLYHTVDL